MVEFLVGCDDVNGFPGVVEVHIDLLRVPGDSEIEYAIGLVGHGQFASRQPRVTTPEPDELLIPTMQRLPQRRQLCRRLRQRLANIGVPACSLAFNAGEPLLVAVVDGGQSRNGEQHPCCQGSTVRAHR